MRSTALLPVCLLVALCGCAQHSSTVPAATQPDPAAPKSDTNMFGEDKSDAAGDASKARDAAAGSGSPADSSGSNSAPAAPAGAQNPPHS